MNLNFTLLIQMYITENCSMIGIINGLENLSLSTQILALWDFALLMVGNAYRKFKEHNQS